MAKGRFTNIALGLGHLLILGGCALVADLGDRQLGDITSGDGGKVTPIDGAGSSSSGGSGSSSGSSGSVDSGSSDGAPQPGAITGFSFHRLVTLTSDAAGGLANQSTLIVLPSTFPYEHAKPNGEDLRFSTTANHTDDLSYFIEKWTVGGESLVWIRVATVSTGASMVHMFYGKPAALDQASFGNTFPNAKRTGGGGAGSFTATGDIDVDWFELKSGDTLTLGAGTPLKISARRIIVAGTIDGDGRGNAGGAIPNGKGFGPGAGSVAPNKDEGSGGGGYGGAGGHGGEDNAGGGGLAGPANGDANDDAIAMGSGGAATDDRAGGAGGGSVTLLGWKTTVTGTIRLNGADGEGLTNASGHEAGAGSGGGLLMGASFLELAGATLRANGGLGGLCTSSANDGGGGGGGGRIKLRRRTTGSFNAPATMTVALGGGGGGNGTTAPGENGSIGTTHVNEASTLLRGIETKLGNEEPAP